MARRVVDRKANLFRSNTDTGGGGEKMERRGHHHRCLLLSAIGGE